MTCLAYVGACVLAMLPATVSLHISTAAKRQLPTIFAHDVVSPTSWYSTFRPVPDNRIWRLSLNVSAAQLLVRDRVCIVNGTHNFQGSLTISGSPPERTAMQGLLDVFPIPPNYSGPVQPGLTSLVTVHHYGSYWWANIEHLAEAVLPIFDTLDLIGEEGARHYNLQPITNILLHQASAHAPEYNTTDWFLNFLHLLGTNPNQTKLFFSEDIANRSAPLCFEQALLLDRPSFNSFGHMQRNFFTYTSTAYKWRQKAFNYFRLPPSLSQRQPARQATFILRDDSQGLKNHNAIVDKVRQFLADRCWDLNVYVPGASQFLRIREQVEQFANMDLSISVHGAHITNLMFQPKGAGVLIIQKCGFEDKDYTQLALESGLAVFTSYPGQCHQPHSNAEVTAMTGGNVTANIDKATNLPGGAEVTTLHQEYNLDFDLDLRPSLEEALNVLELLAIRGPPCNSSAQSHS